MKLAFRASHFFILVGLVLCVAGVAHGWLQG